MGKFLDSLRDYFENTPPEVLDADWEELKNLNDFGSDVLSYAETFEYAVSPYAFGKGSCINDTYKENAKCYLAA